MSSPSQPAQQIPRHRLHLEPNARPLGIIPDPAPAASEGLPEPKVVQTHARSSKYAPTSEKEKEDDRALIYFVGTATMVLEWQGARFLTDPNFLHAGDHVHLGPGVTGERRTNPAVEIQNTPGVDAILLSHFHEDHFDKLVQQKLRRDIPIITTPHTHEILTSKEHGFESVYGLNNWEAALVSLPQREKGKPQIRVVGMPGKHVAGVIGKVNEWLDAIPPVTGFMLEYGWEGSKECAYRIYISGDTVFVDDLAVSGHALLETGRSWEKGSCDQEIPERFPHVDLLIAHLGGTTIPSPKLPMVMVTMDAAQGVKLVQLIKPDLTLPIHYDDYDVFLSPLHDFKKTMKEAGLDQEVVYLERGDAFHFWPRAPGVA